MIAFLRKNIWLSTTIILCVFFMLQAGLTRLLDINDLPLQFYGIFLEAIVTGLITLFLLKGQTDSAEKQEVRLKIFEKKQEVYHNFLERLKEIIMDGKITSELVENERGEKVDEIKAILFELGYIQMHTESDNTLKIFELFGEIAKLLKAYDRPVDPISTSEFYSQLSEYILGVVSILKNDLYEEDKTKETPRNQENATKLVEATKQTFSMLYEMSDSSKEGMQAYFWEEVKRQFEKRGYACEPEQADINWKEEVDKYYRNRRNRLNKIMNIKFPFYRFNDGGNAVICIQREQEYYYIMAVEGNAKKNEAVRNVVRSMPGFKGDQAFEREWHQTFNKPAPKLRLNFWSSDLESEAFVRLADYELREQFISDIVDEVVRYANEFTKRANEANLGISLK